MIVAGSGLRVVVATRPVDFRKGHDGLVAVVEHEFGLDHIYARSGIDPHRSTLADWVGKTSFHLRPRVRMPERGAEDGAGAQAGGGYSLAPNAPARCAPGKWTSNRPVT